MLVNNLWFNLKVPLFDCQTYITIFKHSTLMSFVWLVLAICFVEPGGRGLCRCLSSATCTDGHGCWWANYCNCRFTRGKKECWMEYSFSCANGYILILPGLTRWSVCVPCRIQNCQSWCPKTTPRLHPGSKLQWLGQIMNKIDPRMVPIAFPAEFHGRRLSKFIHGASG